MSDLVRARQALVDAILESAAAEFPLDASPPVRETWRARYWDANQTAIGWSKEALQEWSDDDFRRIARRLRQTSVLRTYMAFFPADDFLEINLEKSLEVAARAYVKSREPASIEQVLIERERALKEAPITWAAKGWLQGIRVHESVPIFVGCELRPVRLEDLTEFRERLDGLRSDIAWFRPPHALLAVVHKCAHGKDVQGAFTRTMTILRLYSGLPVFAQGYVVDASLTGDQNGFVPTRRPAKPNLNPAAPSLASLGPFHESVLPALTSVQAAGTRASIAVERFEEALLYASTDAQAVAIYISALEAILGQEKDAVVHRLAERVAVLLSLKGFEPLPAYRLVKKAYEVRSAYFHGTRAKNAAPLVGELNLITRQCISLVLQLPDDLLPRLTDAILDLQKREELRRLADAAHMPAAAPA